MPTALKVQRYFIGEK